MLQFFETVDMIMIFFQIDLGNGIFLTRVFKNSFWRSKEREVEEYYYEGGIESLVEYLNRNKQKN